MAKSLRDRILEALKKESLTVSELTERLGTIRNHVMFELFKLEEERLVEYDLATEKWHLKVEVNPSGVSKIDARAGYFS